MSSPRPGGAVGIGDPGRPLRLAGTLAVAAAGGFACSLIGLPLAWLIGAVLVIATAAMAGAPVFVYANLRSAMSAVLGVMLGSSFTPDLLDRLAPWALTLSALVPYIAVAGGAGYFFLRRFGGYDRPTAYFTAMPGGFAEMTLVGAAMGGDERTISLGHSTRILMVVLIVPPLLTWAMGAAGASGGSVLPAPSRIDGTWLDFLLLAGCVVGWPIAKRLRLPAPALAGPMLLSAILHLTGGSEVAPPQPAISAAQVVLGAALGARFAGYRAALLVRTVALSAGLTLVLLATAAATMELLHLITGISHGALLLAYLPGGISEMSLVALALGIDAAFVAVHHIIRLALVIALAPLAFRLARLLRPPHPGQ